MNKQTLWKVMLAALLFLPTQQAPPRCMAQTSTRTLITEKSIGPVRLGMTVARVRKALPGYKLSRTSDGEGLALIAVERRGKTLLTLYAGELDPNRRINDRAVIEHIEAIDASYRTSAGVHTRMSLREVEKRYGKLKEITLSEIESREYASFDKQPAGIHLRVMSDSGAAGTYAEGKNSTKQYAPNAYVFSISINGIQRRSHKN
ncbi:MAG TPA: hypothetical protein VF074_06695 [Pyrinomonadaceae bacterium]